jgi:APA family basic amino acid/polyamine antiporter
VNTQRQLGLATATALVVANMIGTGVFTTSGFLLADLKSPWIVLAAWVVGGVIAMLGALSYGALARRIPESGGEYIFLSRTLHPAAGYLAGWVSCSSDSPPRWRRSHLPSMRTPSPGCRIGRRRSAGACC